MWCRSYCSAMTNAPLRNSAEKENKKTKRNLLSSCWWVNSGYFVGKCKMTEERKECYSKQLERRRRGAWKRMGEWNRPTERPNQNQLSEFILLEISKLFIWAAVAGCSKAYYNVQRREPVLSLFFVFFILLFTAQRTHIIHHICVCCAANEQKRKIQQSFSARPSGTFNAFQSLEEEKIVSFYHAVAVAAFLSFLTQEFSFCSLLTIYRRRASERVRERMAERDITK